MKRLIMVLASTVLAVCMLMLVAVLALVALAYPAPEPPDTVPLADLAVYSQDMPLLCDEYERPVECWTPVDDIPQE